MVASFIFLFETVNALLYYLQASVLTFDLFNIQERCLLSMVKKNKTRAIR